MYHHDTIFGWPSNQNSNISIFRAQNDPHIGKKRGKNCTIQKCEWMNVLKNLFWNFSSLNSSSLLRPLQYIFFTKLSSQNIALFWGNVTLLLGPWLYCWRNCHLYTSNKAVKSACQVSSINVYCTVLWRKKKTNHFQTDLLYFLIFFKYQNCQKIKKTLEPYSNNMFQFQNLYWT